MDAPGYAERVFASRFAANIGERDLDRLRGHRREFR